MSNVDATPLVPETKFLTGDGTFGDAQVILPHPSVVRRQQSIALAVIAIPTLGTLCAAALAWWEGITRSELGILVAMYVLCEIGISVGFHRYFTHRSFETNSTVRNALGVLGSMNAQGPIVFWVATHRRHHRYSDRDGDPHSPNLYGRGFRNFCRGLWHAYVGWMFSRESTNYMVYARDILTDKVLLRINNLYPVWVLLGLLGPAVVGVLVSMTAMGFVRGFLWGGLVRMFLINNVSWCVGTFCHIYGSRPFQTGDGSTNNIWIALPSFGEGNHNNHHAFPTSAKHGLEWWQPDLSAYVIALLRVLGLVWEVHVPSVAARLIKAGKDR